MDTSTERIAAPQAAMLIRSIDPADPESAHATADALLLAAVDADVANAYRALRDRCSWWACA